jgi:diguanylate cyclase (GGDEF)-like protein
MTAMPEPHADMSHLGRRLRRKILWALALSSVLPLLVLAYVVQVYVLPALDSREFASFVGLQALVFFSLLAMLVGAWIIWSIGRSVAHMADLMGQVPSTAPVDARTDEIGTIMRNFSKMFETIEQQANEINGFATRLDAAYQELETTNARLKETSFKDDVTGLYNRRFFTIRLEEEISRHRRFNHPVSVVLLDLDGFKQVNDEFGHAMGDETLRDVAQMLMRHSRGINVVSRYGGDEFVVLLVETSKTGACLYADRIREVIAKHPFPHGKPVTASLGVASLPDDDVASADDLFRLADAALYAAKRAGKNQVAATDSTDKKTWNAATS